MLRSRCVVFAAALLLAPFICAIGQRRWERLPAPRDPQFYEPRNKLEDFDGRMETLLIKGRHWTGSVRAQNGSVRVEATEIRDARDSARATGVVLTLNPSEQSAPPGEIRSLVDYEEIDKLIKAVDTMIKADDTVTRLSHFEERYRTRGDFEVIVFKQLSGGGVAAAIEGGFFERVRLFLTLDDLSKLRWMIAQAKDKLDELK